MNKLFKQTIFAIVITPFLLVGSAQADESGGGGKGGSDTVAKEGKKKRDKSKHVCAQDRKKFCGEIQPGEGRIAACMEQNKDKLSADCKAHRELMKEERGDVLTACSEEIKNYCPAPPTDSAVANAIGSETRKCLALKIKAAKVDTSIQFRDACKAEFTEFRKNRRAGINGKVGAGGTSTSAE